MYLQTKEDIKDKIGNKRLFKKYPKIQAVLTYGSGIRELTLQKSLGELSEIFFMAQYPKGILIADRKKRYRIGLSFSELKNIDFIKQNIGYELVINTSRPEAKPIVFSFQNKDLLSVLPFVKLLPYKEVGDPRDEKIAREEIFKLKDEFASDYFTDRTFCQEMKSVAQENVMLEINEHYIKYGDRVIDPSSALGYTISIEEVSHYGVSKFEYKINIYDSKEHLFISYSSVSFFLKEGEYSNILEQIGLVLFDVVSRPIVAGWLDKFANGENVEYKDFALTREGLLLKTRIPSVLIHWDEIIAQNTEMFRWPYSNTVFQRIDSSYDQRGNMLLFLITWLQSDTERLKALMGREFYVS